MDVDTVQWLVLALVGLGSAFQGACLWAVAKRVDLHVKRKSGHDGRN